MMATDRKLGYTQMPGTFLMEKILGRRTDERDYPLS